jgi:hypothetical protein
MLTAWQLHQKFPTLSVDVIQAVIDRWEQAKKTAPSLVEVDAAYDRQESAWRAFSGHPCDSNAKELTDAVADFDAKYEARRFSIVGPQFCASRSDDK